MSGIVGSKLNVRGSGIVAKLGTDGQVLTSAGAGVSAVYEDLAAGISWQSVETGATFTAVAGNGYPVNTTAQACTVTLPAGSVGDTIEFVDYAGTWDTNMVALTADGSEKIKGSTDNVELTAERQGIKIVYVDATQGWVATTGVNDDTAPALNPPSYDIDFLVVAGGASGSASNNGGGGGAGGYRTSTQTTNTNVAITVTVGDGGTTVTGETEGNAGSASSFSGTGLTTISSAGGGAGGSVDGAGGDGGSGGGGGYAGTVGASSPVTSPVQGYAGGLGLNTGPAYGGGGGGGASEVGYAATSSVAGAGGDGVASSISGSSITRGGGGGGTSQTGGTAGLGGSGGGGAGTKVASATATSGTVNTGGGGGASKADGQSGAGGKGVVVLSMPDANYSTTVTGSPTVATGQGAGSDTTTLVFTGDGSYTT